ncbi:SRP54-type protein, GTPase domain [Brevinema andersonii]|uniref:Flagellar biosynthesis protein FlhF n=1 Tax=Brevinema andersonii TaxID=34097 RepID=A0A1I1E3Y2_BREAD|nr:hypothetical protein [Brevinema andersonii]SFB81362.1 SRP54-type protein, GTPase domain [Brevinema andersonii]
MKYVTFQGKTKQEAMAQFNKKDPSLRDARLITTTEEEISSFLGLKKEKIYKVTVGIPEHFSSREKILSIDTEKAQSHFTPYVPSSEKLTATEKSVLRKQKNTKKEDSLFLESISRVADKISKMEQTETRSTLTPIDKNIKLLKENDLLKQELSGLRNDLKEIQNMLFNYIKQNQNNLFHQQAVQKFKDEQSLPDEYQIHKQHIRWLEQFLRDRDFAEYFITQLIQEIENEPNPINEKNSLLLKTKDFLKQNIPQADINIDNYTHQKIMLIGPTGIGKTSTLVKLAAHIAYMRKKSFRFISLDKYKIGGESQLKKLSSYMQAEFIPITKQEDFLKALHQEDTDYTFIDTAGKSPSESLPIQELANWIQQFETSIDIHLILSATTKFSDLDAICNAYNILPYKHFIITKLDETQSYGSILSIAYKYQMPLSFLADGQEIPQDFGIIDLNKLINDALI